jgi:hypothetical protein
VYTHLHVHHGIEALVRVCSGSFPELGAIGVASTQEKDLLFRSPIGQKFALGVFKMATATGPRVYNSLVPFTFQ